MKSNLAEDGLHHIELSITTARITVHGIYRPPGYELEKFLSLVENIVSSSDPNTPCFILGDMNLAINDAESRGVQKYLQLLESYNMVVTNTYCTRPVSDNILDHVVCLADISEQITNYTMDCNLSDHSYVMTHFETSVKRVHQTLTKSIINHRQISMHFQAFLETHDFSCLQPNEQLLAITSHFTRLKDSFTKKITVNVKMKKNVCPWFNFDIWKLSRISNNLYRRWKVNREDQRMKDLLNHANKRLAEAKRRAKSSYYQRLYSAHNPKQLWDRINDMLGNHSGKTQNQSLVVDGTEITEPEDLGNVYNNFFSSVGENAASCLNSDGDINRFNTIEYSSRSIFMRPASPTEVSNIIRTLDSSKATGVDGFPVSALKQFSVMISQIICTCFNDCLTSGIYPDCLKKAIVYPVFKGGDPKNPTNYRPISVLPAINKVFEKLLSARLSNFLDSTALLNPRQFGFRQGSSTEVAVLELVDDIAHSVDQKLIAGVVFLDLSKAFDTIDHLLLLKKLDAYGIRGVANDLLRSYLSDRQQKVMISGVGSDFRSVKCGVPQGSNLGPLLFLIYINDIAKLRIKGHPRLFADDTAITYKANSITELYAEMSNDLQLVTAFLENNLLSLNLRKTKLMVFGAREDHSVPHPVLIVNGVTIEEVSSYKYLGIHIDNNLRWDYHIKQIVANCASLCGMLRKLSKFVPQHVLLKVYFAFIHSRYQYGITTWGSTYNTHLKDIQVQQNRCMKAIFKLEFLYPTNLLYSNPEHTILPIQGLFTMRTCVIMFKILNNLNLHHNWNFSTALHQHHTRYAHLLQRTGFRTEIGRKRFQNMGPHTYNQIPEELKHAQTVHQFKRSLISYVKANIDEFIVR